MSLEVSIVLIPDRFPVTFLCLLQHHSMDEEFENSLIKVQIQFHHFVLCELHDQVRIPSLTLSNRRINVDDELGMNVVGFREEEESFDLLIRNSVVVSFTT